MIIKIYFSNSRFAFQRRAVKPSERCVMRKILYCYYKGRQLSIWNGKHFKIHQDSKTSVLSGATFHGQELAIFCQWQSFHDLIRQKKKKKSLHFNSIFLTSELVSGTISLTIKWGSFIKVTEKPRVLNFYFEVRFRQLVYILSCFNYVIPSEQAIIPCGLSFYDRAM